MNENYQIVLIAAAWQAACEACPTQRIGQVLENACPDLYYLTAEEIIEQLTTYARPQED